MTSETVASASDYRQAMRKVPSAVTVISAAHEGRRRGLTATAVCSVSAEPPQILVCVNKAGRAHACIAQAGRFGVNFLSHDQSDLARAFASPASDPDERFEDSRWRVGESSVPLLADALVAFECRTAQAVDCGTHTVFVGIVTAMNERDDLALLYKSGAFSPA